MHHGKDNYIFGGKEEVEKQISRIHEPGEQARYVIIIGTYFLKNPEMPHQN
jgi:hypothetical protein